MFEVGGIWALSAHRWNHGNWSRPRPLIPSHITSLADNINCPHRSDLPPQHSSAASSIDLFLLTNLNRAILIESLLLSLTDFTAREDRTWAHALVILYSNSESLRDTPWYDTRFAITTIRKFSAEGQVWMCSDIGNLPINYHQI
jgi:hypothetical protein